MLAASVYLMMFFFAANFSEHYNISIIKTIEIYNTYVIILKENYNI